MPETNSAGRALKIHLKRRKFMEILIISGMSGAGKSQVADILEDMNFYCVDNMPTELIPLFVEFCLATKGRYERVALVADVRSSKNFDSLFKSLEDMKNLGCDYKILYLEASAETIANRYKETRRKHPLAKNGKTLIEVINREIEILKPVKDRADYIINTTNMKLSRLHQRLTDIFSGTNEINRLNVNVISFGYKYGVPIDADIVFDVRFLANPYYVTELRTQNGLDKAVSDYIFSYEISREFMKKFEDMVEFLLPNYVEEGKSSLTIAVGCTGGHHRSVAVAHELAARLSEKGYAPVCRHRDIEKS